MYQYRCYGCGGMCDAGNWRTVSAMTAGRKISPDGSPELAEEKGTQSADPGKIYGTS